MFCKKTCINKENTILNTTIRSKIISFKNVSHNKRSKLCTFITSLVILCMFAIGEHLDVTMNSLLSPPGELFDLKHFKGEFIGEGGF